MLKTLNDYILQVEEYLAALKKLESTEHSTNQDLLDQIAEYQSRLDEGTSIIELTLSAQKEIKMRVFVQKFFNQVAESEKEEVVNILHTDSIYAILNHFDCKEVAIKCEDDTQFVYTKSEE